MTESAICQCLRRVIKSDPDYFKSEQITIINPDSDMGFLAQQCDQLNAKLFRFDQVINNASNESFIEFDTASPHSGTLLINLPKAKSQVVMLLTWLKQPTLNFQQIYLIGENSLGAKSFAKLANKHGIKAICLENACRCRLFELIIEKNSPQPFEIDSFFDSYQSSAGEIYNLPGVFSHNRIDKGSQILIDYLKSNNSEITGSVLDFGCGSGIISLHLTHSQQITAIDCDVFAIYSFNKTLSKLKLNHITPIIGDGIAQIEQKFDWILSNPPFHQGKQTDYTITARFFAESVKKLNRDGKLLLIVNDFLDYESQLRQLFNHVECLQRQAGFKLLFCRGPKK